MQTLTLSNYFDNSLGGKKEAKRMKKKKETLDGSVSALS